MTLPLLFRRAAAALLVAAAGLAALPGCGGSKPQPDKKDEKKDDKKEEKKGDGKGDAGTAAGDKKDGPPASAAITDPFRDVDPAAMEVFKAYTQSPESARSGALSAGLLKVLGKPLSPDDIENKRAANSDAAARWLRNVGSGYTFGVGDAKQAGPAAYFRGTLYGRALPKDGGSYAIRLLKEADGWKIDALAVSSLDWKGLIQRPTADEAFQEFAAAAFVEALCDAGAMADESRKALARFAHPDLLKRHAPLDPTSQLVRDGWTYKATSLGAWAQETGGNTTAYTLARAGGPTFTAELTRPAGKKTVTLTLTQGATPGEWLVSEVNEKG